MAIDDNTSYELTGAQVKDLANKIKAKADDNIFVGATSAIPGSKGLVPAPQAGDDTKFLSGDGTWEDVPAGTTYTAGNGIVIDQNDEISIDTSVVAEVSDLPTKTSDLQNDGSDGTSTYVEADDLATVATSGDYGDLLNKPTIPTVNDAILTITQNGTSAGTFTANSSTNTTIALTDTTYSDFTGATSLADGAAGLVPKPLAGDETKFLSGNGQWTTVSQYNLPIASANDLGGIKVGTNLSIDSGTGVLSATDTTYSAFTGATTQQAGVAGLVPAPTTSDPEKYLKGDGTWGTPASGSAVTLFMYDSMGDLYDASSNYATAQDVLTALGNGKVIIGDIIDYPDSAYEIVSSDSDSYFVAVSRHANGSPEFVTLHYDSTSPAAPMGAWTRTAYIPQQKLTAGTNVSISGTTISATDTTYSNFTGATSSVAGANGLVPAPAAGDQGKALKGDGTWGDFSEKFVIMKYGESSAWSKFLAAYKSNAVVYCRASSNANPATGSQTRLAFMAYVNNETSPTEVEFQYVRSVGTKTSSQPVDQVFVYKLTSTNGGTWSVQTRDMAPKLAAGTNTSVSYSSGTYTVSATDTTYSNMTGATSGTAGAAGLVPAPAAGDQDKVLSGAGTWVAQSGGTTYTAGSHIDITSDVISAEGYIWGDDAAPATTPASTITSAMIVDGTIQATDIATGVVPIITMTDTDPGEGSPLAANNFIAVYGDDPSNMNYSLNEAKTGATWIDGSPIYKKTINFGALPNATTKSVSIGVANVDHYIKFEGVAWTSTGTTIILPFVNPASASYQISAYIDSGNMMVAAGDNKSGYSTCYVTVYYTKSS